MTIEEAYNVLTVNTSDVVSEELYYYKFGRILREMRINKNLTITDVCNGTGISKTELREYEEGIRPIELYTALRLLGYLEYPNTSNESES